MDAADLVDPDNSYYRDNLLCLLDAIDILCRRYGSADSGDWYGELRDMLDLAGADTKNAEIDPHTLAKVFLDLMLSRASHLL